jgi:hypothetical protein
MDAFSGNSAESSYLAPLANLEINKWAIKKVQSYREGAENYPHCPSDWLARLT